jgi:hypothetical protein
MHLDHTAIVLIIILIFWSKVYAATGSQIGSPGKMWNLFIEAAERNDSSEGVVEEKRGTNGLAAPIFDEQKE